MRHIDMKTESLIQTIVSDILKQAVIVRCPEKFKDERPDAQQQWCLLTKDKKKLLGRHPSKQKALDQEKAVQYFKHKSAAEEPEVEEMMLQEDEQHKAIPTDGNINLFNEI